MCGWMAQNAEEERGKERKTGDKIALTKYCDVVVEVVVLLLFLYFEKMMTMPDVPG